MTYLVIIELTSASASSVPELTSASASSVPPTSSPVTAASSRGQSPPPEDFPVAF